MRADPRLPQWTCMLHLSDYFQAETRLLIQIQTQHTTLESYWFAPGASLSSATCFLVTIVVENMKVVYWHRSLKWPTCQRADKTECLCVFIIVTQLLKPSRRTRWARRQTDKMTMTAGEAGEEQSWIVCRGFRCVKRVKPCTMNWELERRRTEPKPESVDWNGEWTTFDHSEHSVGLIQRDGEAQSFQIFLLMEQVGQLLLP